MKIQTNYKRAVEVTKAVIGMLERRLYPFDQENLWPDAIIPDGIIPGSKEHALFLFYGVSLDMARDSQRVWAAMRALQNELKELSLLCSIDRKKLKSLLETHLENNVDNTPGKPVEILIENSLKLAEKYEGDPRNIRKRSKEGTYKALREFRGYGKKNPALLIKNYVKFGIWNFSPHRIWIKPDRHTIRISLGSGVLETNETVVRGDECVELIKDVYKRVCQNRKISAVTLNDATWATGSRICYINSKHYCDMHCKIGCKIRPKADKTATLYYPQNESREITEPLFKS